MFGDKNNRQHLMKLRVDYNGHLYYIYLMAKGDSISIQILVNMPWTVPYIRYRIKKPKLITYASKRLTEAEKNYSLTELEMCGLAINIMHFAHLLRKVDFDATVDHLSLVHILKSKTEPTTTRIKTLLEVLSAYSFNLYYMKGKYMTLSDFLSRQMTDHSNPHEIIPI